MPTSIYAEKKIEPTDKMLVCDLADSKLYLDKIAEFIENEYGYFKTEWKFYNQKSGWILKMLTKKRNVLFIIPCKKHFQTAFTFGEKAADVIFQSKKISDSVKKNLQNAKKYAEGRTIQVEVKTEKDLETIIEMIQIKLKN